MKNIRNRPRKNKNLHRSKLYKVICGSEEYKSDPRRTNPYDGYDYNSIVSLAKRLTDKELKKMGYECVDDFLDELSNLYSITELERNNKIISEDLNKLISKLRRLYYSGARKTFRQFLADIEDLTDTVE
mgnify:CR=1 FL=1